MHSQNLTTAPCLCGTTKSYGNCCQRFHDGQPAPTPKLLMRSRYTAFALELADYLLATWHPSTRPESLDLTDSPQWAQLQVLSSEQNTAKGKVHFRAIYKVGSGLGYLEEKSAFTKENGRWWYVDGETSEGRIT